MSLPKDRTHAAILLKGLGLVVNLTLTWAIWLEIGYRLLCSSEGSLHAEFFHGYLVYTEILIKINDAIQKLLSHLKNKIITSGLCLSEEKFTIQTRLEGEGSLLNTDTLTHTQSEDQQHGAFLWLLPTGGRTGSSSRGQPALLVPSFPSPRA